MRFRKKPVVVEAVRWVGLSGEYPAWLQERLDEPEDVATVWVDPEYAVLRIETLEGRMTAVPGDWVIRGVAGELYPCKPEIFKATYELV